MMRQIRVLVLAFVLTNAITNVGKAAFNGHVSIVNSVAFSANGHWALSGSWGWTMRLWDLRERRSSAQINSQRGNVYAVAVQSLTLN